MNFPLSYYWMLDPRLLQEDEQNFSTNLKSKSI
jgi:hypothetical protein